MSKPNHKFLQLTTKVMDLLKNEVELPIAGERVIVRPLKMGSKTELKTAYLSFKSYYGHILKIIYNLIDFVDREKRPTFKEFIGSISEIDKSSLILWIYDTTYHGTFGKQTITCPCGKYVVEDEIKVADVIHPDSFPSFDKTVTRTDDKGNTIEEKQTFLDYEYPIEYHLNFLPKGHSLKYTFYTHLPTMERSYNLVGLLSEKEIQDNLNAREGFMSQGDFLALVTKRVVSEHTNPENVTEIQEESDLETLKMLINEQFNMDDGMENIIEKYNEEFNKYTDKLFKKYKCHYAIPEKELDLDSNYEYSTETMPDGSVRTTPICAREFDKEVSPEMMLQSMFFRRLQS